MTGWNTSDGTVRTGQTKVPVETPAGTRVMVWTDRRGGLTSKPVTHQEAQAQTVLVGVVAAMGAGGAVLCGAGAVRGGLDRRRMTAWDEEWPRIDTRRRPRARGPPRRESSALSEVLL
ncbi:hypothetical protein [Streptomyces caniscabiei]|uniref:Rv1733c family protein n=1 Tax=Streptomyces caniscabiei TaxID=2746961 RepID=UPI0015C4F5AF|nr:hypothetical protein [Streptomyces caniscabiei]